MNFKLPTLILFSMAVSMSVFNLSAQTCRIKATTIDTGKSCCTDVFEYDYVEQKPEYPGGRCAMIKFINATRQYPAEAYENGIEGRVTCSFIVQPDGKICNINVLRGVEASLNNEAVRIVSLMPDWVPGKINEVSVPVRVVCSVPFRK